MTRATDWLDGYLRAWRSKDAADVRAIFTDDAEYWFRPDDPCPVIGIDAIVQMWMEPERADPQMVLGVLIENERLAIVKGQVDYPGDQIYSNLWEVHLAEDGRAHRFIEWFMVPRGGSAASAAASD